MSVIHGSSNRMNGFARDLGILNGDVPYEKVVATQVHQLWNA